MNKVGPDFVDKASWNPSRKNGSCPGPLVVQPKAWQLWLSCRYTCELARTQDPVWATSAVYVGAWGGASRGQPRPQSCLAHSGTLGFHLHAFGLTETRDGAQGYWKWGLRCLMKLPLKGQPPRCKAAGSEPMTQRRTVTVHHMTSLSACRRGLAILPEKSNPELALA